MKYAIFFAVVSFHLLAHEHHSKGINFGADPKAIMDEPVHSK